MRAGMVTPLYLLVTTNNSQNERLKVAIEAWWPSEGQDCWEGKRHERAFRTMCAAVGNALKVHNHHRWQSPDVEHFAGIVFSPKNGQVQLEMGWPSNVLLATIINKACSLKITLDLRPAVNNTEWSSRAWEICGCKPLAYQLPGLYGVTNFFPVSQLLGFLLPRVISN